ncbi:SulP family inorganic anion transporter [Pseudonocardiaceae bacterium YIM PH 21723]|nr:SulP family inorganic anion transporter [Pseudonocardiaceae bacterium YIM PH 21723]
MPTTQSPVSNTGSENSLLQRLKQHGPADLTASLVVFLVALPLCVGIAVASGVPAELGIITGIVGGIVVGMMPGSSLQVSGPAAGLTVLVADLVSDHGIGSLGIVVLAAGALQLLLGFLRLGRWFQAISPAVVQGMLAGIGLVLILGQIYPMLGEQQPKTTAEKFGGLPGLLGADDPAALVLGVVTLAILIGWPRMPARVKVVPGALVAVLLGGLATWVFDLPVTRIEISTFGDAVRLPGLEDFGNLLTPGVLGAALTFALIASAESLFSAAAVDRMHDGKPTDYNRELIAQGTGNAVCGVLGALPMTAVIVRSAANVQAGAKTKASRVLHGVWLLLFVAALPGVLGFVPIPVLAALLVFSGVKLLELPKVIELVRTNTAEAAILLITAVMIVSTDLLIGTCAGLAAAILKTAWEVSHLHVHQTTLEDGVRVHLRGNATFLRLPQLLTSLEKVPAGGRVELDLTDVRHLDAACEQAVQSWVDQRRRASGSVALSLPEPRLATAR